MNKLVMLLSAVVLVLTLTACLASPTSTPAPTSAPTATSTPTSAATPTPTSTATSTPTSTATPRPTSTATPRPTGKLDTGMGGNLSIRGVVKDSVGNVAPNVYVTLEAFKTGVYWNPGGASSWTQIVGRWSVYTDETGSYSFDNIVRMEKGHYTVWLNDGPEYGKVYEESGYYIMEGGDIHLLFIGKGNSRTRLSSYRDKSGYVYTLNVTVHPVTNSALCAYVQYKDADGAIKNFLSKKLGPDHRIELDRGTNHPAGHEYTMEDFRHSTRDGNKLCLRGLAGGTYYLMLQFIRSDGVAVTCVSPSFEILPGQTKQFEYTIQNCSP